jgi:hypothetical protein
VKKDEGSWWQYQAAKLAPKPSYQRPMPTFERKPEPKEEPMVVEESDASDSVIMRIIGKIRGQ